LGSTTGDALVFTYIGVIARSRDITVGKATGYVLDDRWIGV
jgi:hypothetical protein